jgi:hypothetical protein
MFTFIKLLKILPLILLLLAGQLQAKPIFLCSMLVDINGSEVGRYNHESCPNLDYDNSAKLNTLVSDLVFEFDIDPSEEKFSAYTPIHKLRTTVLLSSYSYTNYYQVGSKIHLITQRLRI